MKKQFHTIGLCLLLIAVITGGVWMLREKEPATNEEITSSEDKTVVQQTNTAEPVGYAYEEKMIAKANTKDEGLLWYGDQIVYRYDKKFKNPDTGETVYEMPESLTDGKLLDLYVYGFDQSKNLLMCSYDNERQCVVLIKHHTDGSEMNEEVLFPEWEGQLIKNSYGDLFGRFAKLMADENYYYLHSTSHVETRGTVGKVEVFTQDGKLHMSCAARDFDIDGQGILYIAGQDTTTISKWDVAQGKKLSEQDVRRDYYDVFVGNIDYVEETNRLYLMMSRHMYVHSADDLSEIEILMAREDTMLKMDRYIFTGVLVKPNEDFYVRALESICRYTGLGEKGDDDRPYTLTIHAPYKDDYIAQAISLYEAENTDQHIKYDFAYNSMAEFEENASKDGYFEQTNLKILAGEIGDIVLNNGDYGFFYETLRSDVFEDLTPYIQTSETYSELDPVLLQAITVQEKIKTIPVAADYYFAYVNLDLAEKLQIDIDWENATWSDLFDLHEKLQGTEYVLFTSVNPQRLLSRVLISNMPDLIGYESGKIELEQDWFVDLMMQVKVLWDSPNFCCNAGSGYGIQLPENVLISINGLTNDTWEGDIAAQYAKYNQNHGRVKIIPLFEGEKNSNRTAGSDYLCSISAWSEQKEIAWDFLQFLTEHEMMSRQAMRDRAINLNTRNTKLIEATQKHIIDERLSEQYIREMDQVYDSIDRLYDMGKIKETLWLDLLDYLSGTAALDQALSEAEEAIWLSLNE